MFSPAFDPGDLRPDQYGAVLEILQQFAGASVDFPGHITGCVHSMCMLPLKAACSTCILGPEMWK